MAVPFPRIYHRIRPDHAIFGTVGPIWGNGYSFVDLFMTLVKSW